MRIVHVLSQTHLTGAEAHAVSLAESLLTRGHQVTLISDRFHLKNSAKMISRPIHGARRPWERLREVLFLRRYLKENKIDLVHAHSRAAVRISWWATRGLSTALVSTIHGHQHFSWGKRLFDTYGERVLVVCEALRKKMIRDFKMRPSRMEVLGNPIDITPSAAPTEPSLKRWLFVTRWTGPKGVRAEEFLREVLPEFMSQEPELQFEIAGTPPEPGSAAAALLKQLQQTYGSRFLNRGFLSNVESLYGEYGLVIGGGRICLGALASGRPALGFGEVVTCGLIRRENLKTCVQTNFGDITDGIEDQKLNSALLRLDLKNFLNAGIPAPERQFLREEILKDFSSQEVMERLEEIYRSALLIKAHPKPIPVLMYHKIVEKNLISPHRIFVTAENFRRHLKILRFFGYQSISFKDLLDFKDGRRALRDFPRKPVLLTFDDGYENNLTKALPLLREFGFRATIFLLAEGLQKNSWDEGTAPQLPLMTPPQRQELAKSGVFEIGSHGFRHEKLPGMTLEQAEQELRGSKKALEKEFSRPVDVFAFTYGAIDEQSAALARRAGYRYAVNTDCGAIHLEENPYAVFRVNIFPEDGPFSVLKKVSSWYRFRYYRKRGR